MNPLGQRAVSSPIIVIGAQFLFACAPTPQPPPLAPDPCSVLVAAGGKPESSLEQAETYLRLARERADEGQYTLADNAVACWLSTHPDDRGGRLLKAHVLAQQHRFAESAAEARLLTAESGDWQAWIALGDAEVERGENDAAAAAYQEAANRKPGLIVYDRVGWLRWLEGDVAGAKEMALLAVRSGTEADPEARAWALSRLGWLIALDGPPPQNAEQAIKQRWTWEVGGRNPAALDAALQHDPDYAPALLARGRARLFEADPTGQFAGKILDELPRGVRDGLDDLRKLPYSLEALRWRRDYETVEISPHLDRRGWADLFAAEQPERALALMQAEIEVRHDDVSRITLAWTMYHAKKEGYKQVAEQAMARNCPEPRLIHHAAVMYQDGSLARRALAGGAGLTASERQELLALVALATATP